MAAFAPVSGTFPYYAARWVDPALGFAMGWNYVYLATLAGPADITAAVLLLTFWDTTVSGKSRLFHSPQHSA